MCYRSSQPPVLSMGPKYGAFQLFVPCPENVACKIPAGVSFTSACVLPLSINTAALGLFSKDGLNVPVPAIDSNYSSQTVLIYGGSTSVGSSAIQLAKSASLYVITTASSANSEYCQKLGADVVLDYRSSDWVERAASLVRSTKFAGVFDSIAEPASFKPIKELVSRLGGPVKIAATLPAPPEMQMQVHMAFGANMMFEKDLANAIWTNYMPEALESGKFVPKPDALVTGNGPESLQAALEVQKKGVSARKVVVVFK